MDRDFAIERQRKALVSVLAALLAMAGLAGNAALPSLSRGHTNGASGGRPTLPRHLHRAVLRLLRPAEAAARRLVIMAARGLMVTLPRLRARRPKPKRPPQRPGAVTGIWLPPHLRPQVDRLLNARRRAPALRALPLFDPLPRTNRAKRVASGSPRLCLPGWSAPHPVSLRAPPGPEDRIDAARLALRLAALGRALDDLAGHARRFARWRMRAAATAGPSGTRSAGRPRRLWPLRPGRPLSVSRRAGLSARPDGGIHDILRDTHALALRALERFDTS
jgi:hypothetical protein